MKSLITKENKIEYIKALDWYIKKGHKSHNRFGICYHFSENYKLPFSSYSFWKELEEKPNTNAGMIAIHWHYFRDSESHYLETPYSYTGCGNTPSRMAMVKLLRKALKDSL